MYYFKLDKLTTNYWPSHDAQSGKFFSLFPHQIKASRMCPYCRIMCISIIILAVSINLHSWLSSIRVFQVAAWNRHGSEFWQYDLIFEFSDLVTPFPSRNWKASIIHHSHLMWGGRIAFMCELRLDHVSMKACPLHIKISYFCYAPTPLILEEIPFSLDFCLLMDV